jgi:hypothetical protein
VAKNLNINFDINLMDFAIEVNFTKVMQVTNFNSLKMVIDLMAFKVNSFDLNFTNIIFKELRTFLIIIMAIIVNFKDITTFTLIIK